MAEQPVPLLTFYQGWGIYQRNLKDMIAPLTTEQLATPAGGQEWTLGMIAQHIVANRVWWFQMWMGEGSRDLAPIAHWDPQDVVEQAPLSAAELVAGLDSTWGMISDALARWTADDLGAMFSAPPEMSEEERENFPPTSRRWIIWHVLEHEIHHGGELSLALGCIGMPGLYGSM